MRHSTRVYVPRSGGGGCPPTTAHPSFSPTEVDSRLVARSRGSKHRIDSIWEARPCRRCRRRDTMSRLFSASSRRVGASASRSPPRRTLLFHCEASRPFRSFSEATQTSIMFKSNKLRQAFSREGPSFGLWQMLPGASISRALARTPGIDWVMVDCEHGQMDGTCIPPGKRGGA